MIIKYGISSCVASIMTGLFLLVLVVYSYYGLSYKPPVIAKCHIDQHTSFPDSVVILQQLSQQSCIARRVTLQRQDEGIRVRVL